jgi:hypothetical protein
MKHGGCFVCKSTSQTILSSGMPRESVVAGQKVMQGVGIAVCADPECRRLVEFARASL